VKPPTTFPETPGKLFDLLHEMFGFGYYDDIATETTGGEPWHVVRMAEVSRLKRLLRDRRATEKHVTIAAWHARLTGQVVMRPSDLFALIPVAMRAYNTALAEGVHQDLAAEIAVAIDEAQLAGETEWIQRLIRANTRSVLEEWRSR